MSKHDSSLSKQQQDLLKAFKQQMSKDVALEHRQQVAQVAKRAEQAESELDDASLFAKAVQGVTKISNDVMAPPPKPTRPKVDAQILAKRAAAEGTPDLDMVSAEISDTQAILNPVASQASLSYRIATLQHRVFEDLKAGKLRWYEAVDLHGCTVEQARAAVLQILHIAKEANQTVVKIVHGKGPEAILKTYVNGWLRQHRDVLAFVSAPENQGGTGAVLVLIKRAHSDKSDKRPEKRQDGSERHHSSV